MTKQNPTKYLLATFSIIAFIVMWFTAPHTLRNFQSLFNIALFVIATICYLSTASVYFFLDKRGWLSVGVCIVTAIIPLAAGIQTLDVFTAVTPLIFFVGLMIFDYIIDKYSRLYLKLNFRFIFQQPLKLLFLVLSIGFSLAYYNSIYHQPPDIRVEIPDNVYQIVTKTAATLVQQQMSTLELDTADVKGSKTPDEEEMTEMLKSTVSNAIKSFVDKNKKYVAPVLTAGIFLTLETSSFIFTIFATKLISLTMWLLQVTKLVEKKVELVEKELLEIR